MEIWSPSPHRNVQLLVILPMMGEGTRKCKMASFARVSVGFSCKPASSTGVRGTTRVDYETKEIKISFPGLTFFSRP